MESINEVRIQGRVGSVRITTIGSVAKVARLSVATYDDYRSASGTYIETTWHNVEVWQGRPIADVERITKGAWVKVEGRIIGSRYTDQEGDEHFCYSIKAAKVRVL